MKHFCTSVVLLAILVSLVTSYGCPLKKKKLNKNIKKYNKKCIQKGFQSSLGCEFVDGKLKKKALKQCSKLEQVLKKCGHNCPTDGGWSDFGDWSDCSAACGGGSQNRTRGCSNPAPANGGSNCVGDAKETKECNDQPCYSLKVMCLNYTTLYIDGVKKYTDNKYYEIASLSVPSSSSVIAVKCINGGGGAYWIAAVMKDAEGYDIMESDNSWRCAGAEESGWEKPGFVEGDNWKQPQDLGQYYELEEDKWWQPKFLDHFLLSGLIWSSGGGNDNTAYCRKILN